MVIFATTQPCHDKASLYQEKGFIPMHAALGLTKRQWEIYCNLLMGAHDAADADSGELHALLKRDMVVRSSEVPGGWRAVSPTVCLAAFLRKQGEELTEQSRRHNQVQEEYARFTDEYLTHRLQRGDHAPDLIFSPAQVSVRLNELIASAKHETASLVTNALSAQMLAGAKRGDEALIERGVRVRSIYTDFVRQDAQSMEYLDWFASIGAELRTLPCLPVRMVIVDKSVAVVAANAVDPAAGAVVLRVPGVITALNSLFENLWEQSEPVSDDALRTSLPHKELEILRGLANGAKDETLAHQLGISVRTVRRLLTKLYDRTGAVSRFQMAVEAMRRGWI